VVLQLGGQLAGAVAVGGVVLPAGGGQRIEPVEVGQVTRSNGAGIGPSGVGALGVELSTERLDLGVLVHDRADQRPIW
jgi:hypothetical protein